MAEYVWMYPSGDFYGEPEQFRVLSENGKAHWLELEGHSRKVVRSSTYQTRESALAHKKNYFESKLKRADSEHEKRKRRLREHIEEIEREIG